MCQPLKSSEKWKYNLPNSETKASPSLRDLYSVSKRRIDGDEKLDSPRKFYKGPTGGCRTIDVKVHNYFFGKASDHISSGDFQPNATTVIATSRNTSFDSRASTFNSNDTNLDPNAVSFGSATTLTNSFNSESKKAEIDSTSRLGGSFSHGLIEWESDSRLAQSTGDDSDARHGSSYASDFVSRIVQLLMLSR